MIISHCKSEDKGFSFCNEYRSMYLSYQEIDIHGYRGASSEISFKQTGLMLCMSDRSPGITRLIRQVSYS